MQKKYPVELSKGNNKNIRTWRKMSNIQSPVVIEIGLFKSNI